MIMSSEANQVKARVLVETSDLEKRGQRDMQPEISLVEGAAALIALSDRAVEAE